MTWKDEFPDFPEDDMPELPDGFTDEFWVNDACPSFSTPVKSGRAVLWIDYADPELREVQEGARFGVYVRDDDGEVVSNHHECATLADALAKIEELKR